MPSADPIFPSFSDAEYARRYAAVRAEMEKRGLDAIVAAGDSVFRNSNHANVYWLTNWLDPYAAIGQRRDLPSSDTVPSCVMGSSTTAERQRLA